jgi:hypothetical protein
MIIREERPSTSSNPGKRRRGVKATRGTREGRNTFLIKLTPAPLNFKALESSQELNSSSFFCTYYNDGIRLTNILAFGYFLKRTPYCQTRSDN